MTDQTPLQAAMERLADDLDNGWRINSMADDLRLVLDAARKVADAELSVRPVITEETDSAWQAIADALGGVGVELNSHADTAQWVREYLFSNADAEPSESDADSDTAFELGRVAGYDEAMREVTGREPSDRREVQLNALLEVFSVGSGPWSWGEEFSRIRHDDRTLDLIQGLPEEGMRESILLGSDGRVWDGHHRIVAAMYLGINRVPVAFSGAEPIEWEYGIEYRPGFEEFDGESAEEIQERIQGIQKWLGPYRKTARLVRRRPAGEPEPVPEGEAS